MGVLRAVNLTIRFALELVALGAFGYWGWTLDAPTAMRVVAAVSLPVLVAVLWGLFIAPRARFPTGRVGQSGLGLVVFLAAASALYQRGKASEAIVFGLVATASSLLLFMLPSTSLSQAGGAR